MHLPSTDDALALPFFRFLTITSCPPAWKHFDLYLIRDETVVFYVGQSECAFSRVWEHITGGIKGHAIVGRFLLANWPKSSHFIIELLDSHTARFGTAGYNLDQAEKLLIEQYTPCFNVSLNRAPAPLPEKYLPPNTPTKYLKSFRRMMREAEVAVKIAASRDTEWE